MIEFINFQYLKTLLVPNVCCQMGIRCSESIIDTQYHSGRKKMLKFVIQCKIRTE